MAMTEDQNASIRAFMATNPSADAQASAMKTYGVSQGDLSNAMGTTASTNYSAAPVAAPPPSGPVAPGWQQGVAPAMSDAQNASILDFWNKNQGDASAILGAMKTYGVNTAQLANATGQGVDAVTQWQKANGAADGFGYSVNPYDGWNKMYGTNMDANGKSYSDAPNKYTTATESSSAVYGNPLGGSAKSASSVPVLQSNGVIGSVSQPSTYSAAQTSADTVESRMARLMDPNSAYNQSVAAGARGTANRRGLLNSSIGESMVQDGIIKNALSIASPDAAATNTANQFNANANNQAGQFNASAQNSINLLSQANAYDSIKTAANQANTVANADSTIAANRLTTASSAVTSIMNNTSAYIAAIDRTLSGEAQQALKDGYNTQAKVSLQIIGSLAGDVNLSRYIDSLFTA